MWHVICYVVQNYLTCEAILLHMNFFAPQTLSAASATIIMYGRSLSDLSNSAGSVYFVVMVSERESGGPELGDEYHKF